MPLKKDPKMGGTNADGSKSLLYCSYCFENGEFTSPEMTVEEMKELVKEKLVAMGFPSFLTGFFTKGIPRLERWRKN